MSRSDFRLVSPCVCGALIALAARWFGFGGVGPEQLLSAFGWGVAMMVMHRAPNCCLVRFDEPGMLFLLLAVPFFGVARLRLLDLERRLHLAQFAAGGVLIL